MISEVKPDDTPFLAHRNSISWRGQDNYPKSLTPVSICLGLGSNQLEVAVATSILRPKTEDVRKLWNLRQNRRASPLLLVIRYKEGNENKATVCGPVGENPAVIHSLELSQVERLADAALSEPNRNAASRFLIAMLPETASDMPGLRNSGLLAMQELLAGVPLRSDWSKQCTASRKLLGLSGNELVSGLGFGIATISGRSYVLTIDNTKRAVAVFLNEGETFEDSLESFNGATAVSHALAVADKENLPWVVLTRGREIRLYATKPDVGVGRKGRSETFVEANLSLLPEDKAGYLTLLFGANALRKGGTLEEVLDRSEDFSASLAIRLRDRVYKETVPTLATAIAKRLDRSSKLSEKDLQASYEQTLIVLFRLLFVAYGEDRDLLPYRSNSKYADHSLKRIARHLSEDYQNNSVKFDLESSSLWEDVVQLWEAVDKGNISWGLPSYNGGLFSSDSEVNQAGATLAQIKLKDSEFGPALLSLLVDVGPDGVIGPVDFRSLSVREFGTIYEGLLESMLSVAQSDLTVDNKGNYVPAKTKDPVEYPAGSIYFHNRSGARKASGSYFTKPFAVEHLLNHALEPALEKHLERIRVLLDSGDDAKAADSFFDFRCIDLACGSGHFLVAAVDRIEARFASFLSNYPIPAVTKELAILKNAAREHLGDLADSVEIETTSVLRRQVARRCIYGVDVNHISVELARLAIWIHTFVPGLPLSFLDHSLRHGDSLTGIGTLDEALDAIDPNAKINYTGSFFRDYLEEFLGRASNSLKRLATIAESSSQEIKEARKAHLEAQNAVKPLRQLFDLVVAARIRGKNKFTDISEENLANNEYLPDAETKVKELGSLHFPIAFPEVFIRDNPGFDCILGNPPWEETDVEELGFYALRYPGLKSLNQADQRNRIAYLRKSRPDLVKEYYIDVEKARSLRQLLLAGPYPGMNQGSPDLYKAFAWRFWSLSRNGGNIGVVLPRSALNAKGSTAWRLEILDHGSFSDVTMILNNTQWFFEDVHPQYTIALVTINKGDEFAGTVRMRGPYNSFASYEIGVRDTATEFKASEFKSWSESASFPLIPSHTASKVFRKLRSHPRLDAGGEWSCRPHLEFSATADKHLFDLNPRNTTELLPVYKGASFDIWEPDRGPSNYYAYANPNKVLPVLQQKRQNSSRGSSGVFSGFPNHIINDPKTLPCLSPRIAFRDITRATDSRTVRVCLVRGEIVIQNSAPYLVWPCGDERDQAYLLGVLCSIPLDWYARSLVEIHLNFHLFNALPIPRPIRDNPIRRRVEVIAGRLACPTEHFANWAKAVGVEVGSVKDDEKPELVAELDALVSHLYGLNESDIKVIYDTFHQGRDYSDRYKLVLKYFRQIK